MARRGSLKTRLELTLVAMTVVLLVATAGALLVVRFRDQKRLLEENALTFAETTDDQICQQFRIYYHSGSYKFREIVRRTMSWNRDIHRILILSVSGEVVFDSDETPEYSLQATPPVRRLEDPAIADAVTQLTTLTFFRRDPRLGRLLVIVSPYLEEWGRHPYSVAYVFTYGSLDAAARRLVIPAIVLLAIFVAAVYGVARVLARRVARPIEELTRGVRAFDEGHSRIRLTVDAPDEIEELAQAFEKMADRLAIHVQQLETANAELTALDRMKTDLLANVSHELRTPLSAIRGYAEFMSEGNLGPTTDAQSRGLLICLRNIDRLNRTINMLLDYSRMELGRVIVNPSAFRIDLLLGQIVAGMEAETRKKRLQLTVRAPGDLPPVYADRERMTQVIENLLVNAIKFSPSGGRIVAAAAGHPEGVEITIEDSGIGIPAAEREKVFEKFFQIEAGAARRYGGVGLGLAIVKSIVDAHGIPIAIDASPLGGARFRFVLPIAIAEGSVLPKVVERATERNAAPVLAIDDDADFLAYLAESLRGDGIDLVSALTAAEGLRLARETAPAAILLDVHLPDRDGFEVLRALKADSRTRDVPTILVTVVNDSREGFRLGANDYLVKPVERAVLISAVDRVLGRRSEDEPEPLILVVDDEADLADALSESLASRGYRVATAASGPEALRMSAERRPDLLILDIMMPEMTGWEVLSRLRESEMATLPVIVLSARDTPEDRAMGERLGARAFLPKSSGSERLLAEIRVAVGLPRRPHD